MLKQMINNAIRVIVLLISISILSFFLVSVSPIDPIDKYVMGNGNVTQQQRENLAEHWGTNKSFPQRYWLWVKSLIKGDLGDSLVYRQPVLKIITERFSNTFLLMLVAWIFSGIIGFILGCIMGFFNGKPIDFAINKLSLVINSLPAFWVGMIFLIIFAVKLKWFPVGFSAPIGLMNDEITFSDKMYHLILPAITLSFTSFANIALHTRGKLIEVLRSDYVLFAKSRGKSDWHIFKQHGLKNIILPAVTLQFASISEIFSGSILAENVFSYPGLGTAATQAGLNSDIPLLLGITLVSAMLIFLGGILSNALVWLIDPRTRK